MSVKSDIWRTKHGKTPFKRLFIISHVAACIGKKTNFTTICQGCKNSGSTHQILVINNCEFRNGNSVLLPDVIAEYCTNCVESKKIWMWYGPNDYTLAQKNNLDECVYKAT